MAPDKLPKNVVPASGTVNFTHETIPEALKHEHSLAANHWGVLHVFQGSIILENIRPPDEQVFSAPDLVIIRPEVPHRVQTTGAVRCRIDFFRELDADASMRTPGSYAEDDVRHSFERCEANGNFAETFYRKFLSSSPDVPAYFTQTDFRRQREVLRESVYMMVSNDIANVKLRDLLEHLGSAHGRLGRNIRPELYEHWLDSVCATVAQLDPHWNNQLQREWRVRLRAGMQIIMAAY